LLAIMPIRGTMRLAAKVPALPTPKPRSLATAASNSQSVKTTQSRGSRGCDAAKTVTRRKRRIAVDT
jgi:hypothetical protein